MVSNMLAGVEDLAARWGFARRAAMVGVLGDKERWVNVSDEELLHEALVVDSVGLYRSVFDNSLRLGVGYTKFYKRELVLREIPQVLCSMGVHCFFGAWEEPEEGRFCKLERKGCGKSASKPVCIFYSEAVEGLVLGLTTGVLHARHRSVGAGDAGCVDVFYLDSRAAIRYGEIPLDVHSELEGIRRTAKAFDSSIEVDFVGVSEGVLYYEVHRGFESNVSVNTMIERAVKRKFPLLDVKEVCSKAITLQGSADE